MSTTSLRYPIFLALSGLLTQIQAGTPAWTYSAPNPASVTVSAGETTTVQYTVTNQSTKSKNLKLKPTSGLSASACQLASKGSSCNLTITVTGNQVPTGGIHSGPILCEADTPGNPNPNQCYQPSLGNQLNITFGSSPNPPTQYTNIYAQTSNARVVYSFNNGSTWNSMINQQSSWYWNDYWGGYNPVGASMALDADGAMYQAIQGWNKSASSGQVITSSNGIGWSVMDVTFPGGDTLDASNVSAIYGNTLYVGTVNGYVLSADTSGGSWTTLNGGSALGIATGVSALITDGSGTVYAGLGTGAVYYSNNPTSAWGQVSSAPSSNTIRSLAVTNLNGQATLYASDSSGNAYYSTNNNGVWAAWTQMTINCPADTLTVLAASNNVLYAGTNNGYVFTLTPSGVPNTWDAVQQSSSIDGSSITVLTVTQGPLSPLFVEGLLGSSGNPQALPVNGGTVNLTATNYSQNTATNVQAQGLPRGVIQIPGADCASVISNETCTITLSATQPFAPQSITITGSNMSGPIEYVALVSSMSGYLVYNVDAGIAYVVDSTDASSSSGAEWGPYSPTSSGLGISETSTTPCNGATDGYCDTGVILAQSYSGTYAAGLCAAKNTSSTFPGPTFTPNWWYLPATCELAAGLYGDSSGGTISTCTSSTSSVSTGIFSLYGLGYLSDLATGGNTSIPGSYWGSTEYSGNPQNGAWFQVFYGVGDSSQLSDTKNVQYGVRCVQGFTY